VFKELVHYNMSWFANFKSLTALSVPMIMNTVIQQAQFTSTIIIVGRLGEAKYLGAATLGNMMCNITGYSLGFGLCSALDTLIAQAYGAKEYKLMGLHAQRAAVIMTFFSIPVAIIWCVTHLIVHYVLRIDMEIAVLSGVWARWIVLGLWPTLMFQVLKKLLQGCGIVWPVIIASIMCTVVNIISCYVLIYKFNMGFEGAAISVSICQWAGFLCLALIIYLQVLLHPHTIGAGAVTTRNRYLT
jgi:multidrug resistance protein, MATE family